MRRPLLTATSLFTAPTGAIALAGALMSMGGAFAPATALAAGPPATPDTPDTVPEPGGEPAATEPAEPTPPDVEPAEPQPDPGPSVEASTGTSATQAVERERPSPGRRRRAQPDEDEPVVRAVPDDWGMTFIFGGLAPLSIGGINDFGVNRLLFSEIGFRRMTKNLVIPFSVGAGIFNHNPDSGSTQNDAGLAASVGILRNFRIWRRIVPHVGGNIHIHYLDPTGDNNWLVNFSLGPVIGIEYFFADRASLLMQATALLGVNVFDGLTQVSAATGIAAGGQMGLTFYF